ncbi:sodium/calcium exchanger NCL2-like isoform X1 [Wolffia australiana]
MATGLRKAGLLRRSAVAAAALLLVFVGGVSGRRLLSSPSDSISDGLIRMWGRDSSALSNGGLGCEQTYGFLPCTDTALGNLFLLLVYGYLMFLAATYMSNGSELLLEILGPGIIGGLFLPALGALPDAILILVSGLSGSRETAQDQVLIGMGLLAGSTVMLLTLLWGSCIVVGKCDLSTHATAIDSQDTRKFSLTGSGVSTDVETSHAAKIMVVTTLPFVIVQLPKIFKWSSGDRLTILISLIASAGLLVSYCVYQVVQPWIQERRLAYAKRKQIIARILQREHAVIRGGLLDRQTGRPNEDAIKKIFHGVDVDHDGFLSLPELNAFVHGTQVDVACQKLDETVEKFMKDFDSSHDGKIQEDEFVRGMSRWLDEAKNSIAVCRNFSREFFEDFHTAATNERKSLANGSEEEEDSEGLENPQWVAFQAVSLLLAGAVIAVAFADPLVDAVDGFSGATSIPTFFISFIAMPLATNSSEAVSAIIFASRKKQKTASLTFSEIYGAVTMNNTLCLSVFLALVYVRQLTWDFSAEVLIIIVINVVMGAAASFRRNFPLWTSLPAFLLYPVLLLLVYVLDYIFGWS